MKTKQDFEQVAAAAITEYPVAAQLYQARDQRLLARIGADAAMLALYSQQQDVAAMEPFTKARDVTVLADAAVKGVLPFGKAIKVRCTVTNATANPFTVANGRRLFDTRGRVYIVYNGATVPANDSATVDLMQYEAVSFTHTVAANIPFYRIAIPKPTNGNYITDVFVKDSLNFNYEYTNDFCNVEIGERVFHLEIDENQTMYVQFGAANLAGYQPYIGQEIIVTTYQSEGNIDLAAASQFTFEYSLSPNELGSTIVLDSILEVGNDPMDIATMREVTNFPSIYDTSAVFLGNFDFLVRRNLSPFEFLSVWNEQKEERIRGASVNNINKLFIAAQKEGVETETLQDEISRVILEADDSYKLEFVEIIEETINVTITAYVSPVYDFAAVEQQMREIILANYGKLSTFAKRGSARIKYKNLYDLLETGVEALQGNVSDLQIAISYVGNDDGELKYSFAYSRTGTDLTVTYVAHGFDVGDNVYFTDATDPLINGSGVITAKNDDDFTVTTAADGVDTGTLSLLVHPKPEKWRYVDDESISITIQQAGYN